MICIFLFIDDLYINIIIVLENRYRYIKYIKRDKISIEYSIIDIKGKNVSISVIINI